MARRAQSSETTSDELTTSELLASDLRIALPIPTRVGAARRVLGGLSALAALETAAVALLCFAAGQPAAVAIVTVMLASIARALTGAWFVHGQRILHRAARVDLGQEPFAPSPRVVHAAERAPLAIAGIGVPAVVIVLALGSPAAALSALAAWTLGLAPAARLVAAPLDAWISRLPARDIPDPAPGWVAFREGVLATAPALSIGIAVLPLVGVLSPWGALALAPAIGLFGAELARARLALRELAAVAARVESTDPARDVDAESIPLRTEIACAAWAAVRSEISAATAALRGEADAQRQIEHEEQVRSRFMAAMGHELRSPLNSIVGFAQLLEDGADGPLAPGQRESVVMVRRSAEDLLRLLGDILDSARLDAGGLRSKLEWTPSVEIVTEAVRVGRSVVEGTEVRIEATIQAGLPPVRVDRARIVQAVVATFRHAARGKRSGVLEVRAGVGEGRRGERALRIEVRDEERASSDEELARMFDAFGGLRDASSGRRVGGLGLALSLARKLARLHGGDVWAESRAPSTTRYVVAVPLA